MSDEANPTTALSRRTHRHHGGTRPTSKGSGAALHPSGMTTDRWNWPFKTDSELSVAARWFKAQAHRQRGQGEDALM